MRSVFIAMIGSAILTTAGLAAAAQEAPPDGELVYRQHCARCHELHAAPPDARDLRSAPRRTPEDRPQHVPMRRQGAGSLGASGAPLRGTLTGRPRLLPAIRSSGSIPESAYAGARRRRPLAGGLERLLARGADTRFQPADAAGLTSTTCRG